MIQKNQKHSIYPCASDGSHSPDWSVRDQHTFEQACTLGLSGVCSKCAAAWAPTPEILCSLYWARAPVSGFLKPSPGDANVHPEWTTVAVKRKVLDLEGVRGLSLLCPSSLYSLLDLQTRLLWSFWRAVKIKASSAKWDIWARKTSKSLQHLFDSKFHLAKLILCCILE